MAKKSKTTKKAKAKPKAKKPDALAALTKRVEALEAKSLPQTKAEALIDAVTNDEPEAQHEPPQAA